MKRILILTTVLVSQLGVAQPMQPSTTRSRQKLYEPRSEFGAVIGYRQNTAAATDSTPGVSIENKNASGAQAGIIGLIPMGNRLAFRTGGLLVSRDSEAKLTDSHRSFQTSVKATRTFVDGVAQLAFAPSRAFDIYAGFNLAAKVASSCTADGMTKCKLQDEKSIVPQPVLGLEGGSQQFKLGAFYELETEYSRDWKQSAMGVTGLLMF